MCKRSIESTSQHLQQCMYRRMRASKTIGKFSIVASEHSLVIFKRRPKIKINSNRLKKSAPYRTRHNPLINSDDSTSSKPHTSSESDFNTSRDCNKSVKGIRIAVFEIQEAVSLKKQERSLLKRSGEALAKNKSLKNHTGRFPATTISLKATLKRAFGEPSPANHGTRSSDR